MAEIALKKLAHSYLDNPLEPSDMALKEMDITWQDGKSYALLGPSGCGKSTLLNLISGLLPATRGSIYFDGVDVSKASTTERNIAQVFQFPVVYDTMTVAENLAFPLKNRGFDSAYIEKRVNEIATMIGMSNDLNRKCQGLNADIKQKISLGRGMVREDVNAILFDEPLTVIDPYMKWELRTQLRHLHESFGHTMIYVTHDQTEALTFADEVVVMYDGEMVQTGTPQDLFECPAHRFVGYFIGSPGMNFLKASVSGNEAKIGAHRVVLAQHFSELEDGILLGIRPEHVRLTNNKKAIEIVIKRIEDVGHHRIVRAAIKGLNQSNLSIIVPDGVAINDDMKFVEFPREAIGIYQHDWRIAGEENG